MVSGVFWSCDDSETEDPIVFSGCNDVKVSKDVVLLTSTELEKTLVSLLGNMRDAIVCSVSWLISELPNFDSEISVAVSFTLSSEK